MKKFSSSVRLKHGHTIEDNFQEFINFCTDWSVQEIGQRRLPEWQQELDRKVFVDFKSEIGKEFIDCLPEKAKFSYQYRLKDTGIPNPKRYEPDFLCFYKNKFAFDVDIKSEIGGYSNITYELSGYAWSVLDQRKTNKQKIFVFPDGASIFSWKYLFLDQVLDFTHRFHDGTNCNGSSTPFGLIAKDKLDQDLEHLFAYYETLVFA